MSSPSTDTSQLPLSQMNKEQLIHEILDLQNTFDAISQKVSKVKDDNTVLTNENQVLSSYIENLLSCSAVFQKTGSSTTTATVPSSK